MRNIFKQVLSNLVVFTLPFSLSAAVYFIINSATASTLWLLVAPFLCMYAARKVVKNPYIFLVVHAVIIALSVFIIGDGYSDVPVWVFLGVSTLISIVLKNRNEFSLGVRFAVLSPSVAIALMGLSLLVGADTTQIYTQLIVAFFAAQVINIVFCQMDSVDVKINILTKINGYKDPPNRVLKANNRLITVFVAGIVTFVVVVFFAGGLFSRLSEWGRAYFENRFNVAREIHEQYWPTEWEFEEPIWVDDEEDAFAIIWDEANYLTGIDADVDRDINIFNSLTRIITILTIPTFVLSVLFILFYRKKLYRRSHKPEDASQDEVISLDKNLARDFINSMSWRKRQRRNPVRRAYYKKIKQFIKSGTKVVETDTTDKIDTKIAPMEDISDLTAKYEQVRYGR